MAWTINILAVYDCFTNISGDTETPIDQCTFLESVWGICWGFTFSGGVCIHGQLVDSGCRRSPTLTLTDLALKLKSLKNILWRHIWSSFWACANHHLDTHKDRLRNLHHQCFISAVNALCIEVLVQAYGVPPAISCNHNHLTTTGLYRLGYCTPFMKLSYHSEVWGTYFRGWYSAAPADLLVIVGRSSMASSLGTRIPGHFIMTLANQVNYFWDMDGYGWIWWNFWWN